MASVTIDKHRQAVVPKTVANAAKRLAQAQNEYREKYVELVRVMVSRSRSSETWEKRAAIDEVHEASMRIVVLARELELVVGSTMTR